MKRALGVLVLLLFGSVAYAQEGSHAEVGLNYSYLRFNPGGQIGGHSFNGGGGDVTWFLAGWLGVKAEFEGYGSTQVNFSNANTFANVQANAFTYNFGPVVKLRRGSRFEPFVEALGGGLHSNLYRNACHQIACTTQADNNVADFIVGGGIDMPVGSHLELRPIEVDYVLTRFNNRFIGGNQNQNNVRYVGGVRWRF